MAVPLTRKQTGSQKAPEEVSYDRLGCEHTKATVILSTSVWGSSAGLSPQRFNDWTMDNVPAPLEKSSLSPMGFLWAACHCSPEKEDGIMETLRVLGYPAPSQCDHGAAYTETGQETLSKLHRKYCSVTYAARSSQQECSHFL